MWSAVAAERLGIIGHAEVVNRLRATITTLEGMERHAPDGQFYNWYDHRDGAKLTTWPPTGEPLDPILSSVDNAWLATGLRIVRNARPRAAGRAGAIYDSMDFGFYYVPDENRILFHYSPAKGTGAVLLRHGRLREPDRGLHRDRQGRPAAQGVLRPLAHLPGHLRLLLPGDAGPPASTGRTTASASTTAPTRTRGTQLTPSWGGSMFEALMPALFVPEERVGRRLVARQPPAHGRRPDRPRPERGRSTASGASRRPTPPRAATAPTASTPPGWTRTACRPTRTTRSSTAASPAAPAATPQPDPPPSAYTNGVVTPHAAFLALRYRRDAAVADLAALERDPGVYSKWGFPTRSTSAPEVPSPPTCRSTRG